MKRALALATLITAVPGCRAPDPTPAYARADAAATRLATTLRERLQAAMRAGGPTAAVAVCASEAPVIAARITAETGVRVGRASLRARSPANTPPPWVAAWLRAQGERPAEGVVGARSVADGAARVLRPIAVEPVCVTCHGEAAAMAPALRDAIAAAYPGDRATGYRPGDLRGALWAEAPLAR
jgi:hypothetical protein